MRRAKRYVALLLALLLLTSSGYSDISAAALPFKSVGQTENIAEVETEAEETAGTKVEVETEIQSETETGTETETKTEIQSETETAAGTKTEIQTEAKTIAEAETEIQTETETTVKTEVEAETETTTEIEAETETAEKVSAETETEVQSRALPSVSEAKVNYLVVESPKVEVSSEQPQRIMLGIGDGSAAIEEAVLTYSNRATGESFEASASEILDDFVLFTMEYSAEESCGEYVLNQISYRADGKQYQTSFAEMGIEAGFLVAPSKEEIGVVSVDEQGNVTGDADFESVMEEAGCEAANAQAGISRSVKGAAIDSTGMKSLVIVLDAGHGGNDGGASKNGIVEKNANLKIAQYCKEELEEYSGVTVYMTRSGDTALSLAERAQVAIDKQADLFVSLHNNSNTSSIPSGANVYYPNANYNPSCGTIGKDLASIIESNLTDLGLASGGIHIRNSADTKYPDGSTSDYYGVIRRCKENGIPALIVEHAFVSNPSDAANYLTTDEQLKKLGLADAKGIADYYGLKKGVGFTSIKAKGSTELELSWKEQAGVTGYSIARSTSSGDGFTEVANITPSTITSWCDKDLTSGVTYYYKIRTYTVSGDKVKYSAYGAVASGVTAEAPKLTSLKSKNSKTMEISWEMLENAVNYEIYRADSEKGPYKKLAAVSGINRTGYTDTTVSAGKKYFYRIRSVAQADGENVYSGYSNILSGRTAKKPSDLKLQSKSGTTLRLYWKPDKNAAGYTIKRATSQNGSYKKIGTVTGGEKEYYDDKTVKEDKYYWYKVEAFNYNGDVKGYSGNSGTTYGKTLVSTKITKIVSTSSTKQTISWKKIGGANGYVVYRSTKKDGDYEKIATISSGSTTFYKDKELTAGTKYYYKVKTRNKLNGKTGYGSASSPKAARVGKRASITVTGYSGTKIKISWKEVKDAESYTVYRSTKKDGSYQKLKTLLADTTSYTDSKLKMTKKYYYKVETKIKGYKAVGTSGYSKIKEGYPIRQAEITYAGKNDSDKMEIRWKKVKNITGYEIYRRKSGDSDYALIKKISDYTTTSYTDKKAEIGQKYYYKVRLVNKYDGKTIYGKNSASKSGILIAPPTDVTVTAVSENSLNISWKSVNGATAYQVYRSTEADGAYTLIGTVSGKDNVSYSDETVTKNVIYYYKIKALDASQKSSNFSSAASGCAVSKLTLTNVSWQAGNTKITINWQAFPLPVAGYEVYRAYTGKLAPQECIAKTTATSFTDEKVDASKTYYYRVRPYTTENGRIQYGTFSDTISTNPSDYKIMGSAGATVEQMAAMYERSGKKYPSDVYKGKGAADIKSFCQIVYEESQAEGVKPEVVFAQICHETSYLQFGGQVKAAQCNFGGLGATDDGASGDVFTDIRTGVRSQVQHMKAYASTAPLKNPCIDKRFIYVSRGRAEYIQQLGGGNWATDSSYAVKLMNYINKILQ